MTHSLLPCGPEIVRRQLREDSEVDHFVELTKNEVRGAGLPSMKELVNFTYVGDELHSLRAAAMSMNMAYSKAWTVLRTAQEGLGVKLLRSSTGGRNGGGATLTAEGERLLAAYEDYCAKLTAYGETLFAETFAFYDTLTEEKLE